VADIHHQAFAALQVGFITIFLIFSVLKYVYSPRAFGWKAPKFGHLPLLVNADGTKLSKRQGDIGIQHFRERGYFPLSLVNYVVSAGGGFEHKANAKQQLLSMQNLYEQFHIERVNSHPSRLNPELLDDFNRLEMAERLTAEESRLKLVKQVQELVKEAYLQQ